MMAHTAPNALRVAWSIITSLVRVRSPRPSGTGSVDHSLLADVLGSLEGDPMGRLPELEPELAKYLDLMEGVDPDALSRPDALAFWINVYNAGALRLAASAARQGATTVLGVPGGFTTPILEIAGETLSLDAIEHAEVRRFGDPRIHAGVVCGSVSCPTLRRTPFDADVDAQLADQMKRFLAAGAIRTDHDRDVVTLSPIFSWFGGDFARPHRMPTLLPARRAKVLEALIPWMEPSTTEFVRQRSPEIRFGGYDWTLACSIGSQDP